MTVNKLKSNDEKTELIVFTTPPMHKKIQNTHIQIADANIKSTHATWN